MPWNRLGHHFSSSGNLTRLHIADGRLSLEALRAKRVQSINERERGLDGHEGAGINWIPRINASRCLMGRMCETDHNYPT
jgi:hypothetical protein